MRFGAIFSIIFCSLLLFSALKFALTDQKGGEPVLCTVKVVNDSNALAVTENGSKVRKNSSVIVCDLTAVYAEGIVMSVFGDTVYIKLEKVNDTIKNKQQLAIVGSTKEIEGIKKRLFDFRQPSPSAGKFGVAVIEGRRDDREVTRLLKLTQSYFVYLFQKRRSIIPDLKGETVVKFTIDNSGKVIHTETVQSTLDDIVLEYYIEKRIERLSFGKTDKPGDVTEVIYTLVFGNRD